MTSHTRLIVAILLHPRQAMVQLLSESVRMRDLWSDIWFVLTLLAWPLLVILAFGGLAAAMWFAIAMIVLGLQDVYRKEFIKCVVELVFAGIASLVAAGFATYLYYYLFLPLAFGK
jgi:hypothetical protein